MFFVYNVERGVTCSKYRVKTIKSTTLMSVLARLQHMETASLLCRNSQSVPHLLDLYSNRNVKFTGTCVLNHVLPFC